MTNNNNNNNNPPDPSVLARHWKWIKEHAQVVTAVIAMTIAIGGFWGANNLPWFASQGWAKAQIANYAHEQLIEQGIDPKIYPNLRSYIDKADIQVVIQLTGELAKTREEMSALKGHFDSTNEQIKIILDLTRLQLTGATRTNPANPYYQEENSDDFEN